MLHKLPVVRPCSWGSSWDYCYCTSLPVAYSFSAWVAGAILGLTMKFPRFTLLGDFNFHPWVELQSGSMMAMGLFQVTLGLTRVSGLTLGLAFLLEQWQCEWTEMFCLASLSWSDHIWWLWGSLVLPPSSAERPDPFDWSTPGNWWTQLGFKECLRKIPADLLYAPAVALAAA